MLPLTIRSFNGCTRISWPSTLQKLPGLDDVVTKFCLNLLKFPKLGGGTSSTPPVTTSLEVLNKYHFGFKRCKIVLFDNCNGYGPLLNWARTRTIPESVVVIE